MENKIFKIPGDQIKKVIEAMGSCVASDKITVDGLKVGYMYRETPMNDIDSGWRFMSGLESQEYADDSNNLMFYDVNTIANYDKHIIPYLHLAIGSELLRNDDDDTFRLL